jgi:hypothetical protein
MENIYEGTTNLSMVPRGRNKARAEITLHVSPSQLLVYCRNSTSMLPIHTFHCLVEGDNRVFKVEIAANKEICDLKENIHKKGIGEHPILAKDLTLLKVITAQSLVNTHLSIFCRSI